MIALETVGYVVRIGDVVLRVGGARISNLSVFAQVHRRVQTPYWQRSLLVAGFDAKAKEASVWHRSDNGDADVEVTVDDQLRTFDEPLYRYRERDLQPELAWTLQPHALVTSVDTDSTLAAVVADSGTVTSLIDLTKWRDTQNNNQAGWGASLLVRRAGSKHRFMDKPLECGDVVQIGFAAASKDWRI